jgi:hypothetical protein
VGERQSLDDSWFRSSVALVQESVLTVAKTGSLCQFLPGDAGVASKLAKVQGELVREAAAGPGFGNAVLTSLRRRTLSEVEDLLTALGAARPHWSLSVATGSTRTEMP